MRSQEIEQTMLKARDAKYSVPLRYGKVLFCGATAAGKSNFLNLLMEEDFQPLHISTEVVKSHQIKIATKANISSSDDNEVKFKKMNIDDEILELESYLPERHASNESASSTSTFADHNLQVLAEHSEAEIFDRLESESNSSKSIDTKKLALANINERTKRLNKKPDGKTWDILTFMDTGGQPQFISMLPAVNSFAMVTFIIHKMEPGGQASLHEMVKVPYGNKEGEVTFIMHPHKYTYHQLIETLISYANNILLLDTKFLHKLKVEKCKTTNNRSILLVGTHSGNEKLSEENIDDIDKELTKTVKKSGVNHIKPSLNNNYQSLVPVDNKIQGKNLETQVILEDKKYTKPSEIRSYIQKFLNEQDVIHVPIKWLLLELEIRKVSQEKNAI